MFFGLILDPEIPFRQVGLGPAALGQLRPKFAGFSPAVIRFVV
jgi:hypothetical protein